MAVADLPAGVMTRDDLGMLAATVEILRLGTDARVAVTLGWLAQVSGFLEVDVQVSHLFQ